MKKLLTATMAAITAFGAFAFTGCDNVHVIQKLPTNTSISNSATDFERGEFIVGESTGSSSVSLLGAPIKTSEYTKYNIPQNAESAVLVTATVNPASAVNRVEMNWSVAWKNPSSTWASGKTVTDYVTVTQAGNLTATVTCLQAFGEQVVVTATALQGKSSKSASLTCDYMKRFDEIGISLAFDSNLLNTQDEVLNGYAQRGGAVVEERFSADTHYADFSLRGGCMRIVDFGEESDYTVSTNNYTVTLELEEHVAAALQAEGFDIGTGSVSFDSTDWEEIFLHDWFVLPGADSYVLKAWYEMHAYGGVDARNGEDWSYNAYKNAIGEGLYHDDNVDGYVCYITIALTNQDKSTVYETYKFGCAMADDVYLPELEYAVNSVTLDGDITF